MLLALLVALFLYYAIWNLYFKKGPFTSLGKETERAVSEQGINTATPKTIIDSVKESLRKSQEQEEKHAKGLEDMR